MVVALDRKLRPVLEAMLDDFAATKGNERVGFVNSATEQLNAAAVKEGILTLFTSKVTHFLLIPQCPTHHPQCRPLKTGSKITARRNKARPNPAMSKHILGMLGIFGLLFRRP